MPWSAKAQELLRQQYAAVGAAARASLAVRPSPLGAASRRRNVDALPLTERSSNGRSRESLCGFLPPILLAGAFSERLKLAPFHLLATEGQVHFSAITFGTWKNSQRFAKPVTDSAREHITSRSTSPTLRVPTKHAVVEGVDGTRRRRHGRQTVRLHCARAPRPSSTRRQMPWPRVSADHLRPGVHCRKSGAPPQSLCICEAFIGTSRVCSWH